MKLLSKLLIRIIYFLGWTLTITFLFTHSTDYFVTIEEPISEILSYTPISINHYLTIIIITLLGLISNFLIWKKRDYMSRLSLALTASLSILSIIIYISYSFQISSSTENFDGYSSDTYMGIISAIAPISQVIISLKLIQLAAISFSQIKENIIFYSTYRQKS